LRLLAGWREGVMGFPLASVTSRFTVVCGRDCFFVRPQRFLRPDLRSTEGRAQARSSLAAGHRRRRRGAGLTARARR
jgi:hypothetical protein